MIFKRRRPIVSFEVGNYYGTHQRVIAIRNKRTLDFRYYSRTGRRRYFTKLQVHIVLDCFNIISISMSMYARTFFYRNYDASNALTNNL